MWTLDEERIIGLFLARDQKALEETQKSCGALLLRAALRVLGSRADADECINDALMILWQNIPPAVPTSFRAYACKVVRNVALKRLEHDLAQKRSINASVPIEELEAVLSDERAAEKMSDAEFSQTLDSFLRKLSQEARIVFLKRYFFFDTVPEIARDLNISESKVNSMLFRARKKLREEYEKE